MAAGFGAAQIWRVCLDFPFRPGEELVELVHAESVLRTPEPHQALPTAVMLPVRKARTPVEVWAVIGQADVVVVQGPRCWGADLDAGQQNFPVRIAA
jgi:hypothetical protein